MAHIEQALIHARTERQDDVLRPRGLDRSPAAALPDIRLSVTQDMAALEPEWRRFEAQADCTAFQSFDWLATWQACIGVETGVKPAIVLGRRPDGELLFILPLATQPAGFIRRLTFLGHVLGDYNAPLLAPDFPRLVGPGDFARLWPRIRRLLQQDPGHRPDLVLLDKMPERVGAQRNPFLELTVAANPSGAYLTALSADWEQFYTAKRSAATRRRDRSKRKRLAEAGDVRMVTAHTIDDVLATLATLMAQKSRAFRRMGVPDIFARPGYVAFYSALVQRPGGPAHVSRLQVGDTAAATNLGLVFRGRYYHVLASYDEGPLSRFGPGAAHLHELMRYAIEQGCAEFDFTIGDEPYKRDWCDTELLLVDHIAAASWRGWLAAAPVAALRHIKRAVKQSAILWPLVVRLRAWRAGAQKDTPSNRTPASADRDDS